MPLVWNSVFFELKTQGLECLFKVTSSPTYRGGFLPSLVKSGASFKRLTNVLGKFYALNKGGVGEDFAFKLATIKPKQKRTPYKVSPFVKKTAKVVRLFFW